jgi:large subunit ribosomal protein L10
MARELKTIIYRQFDARFGGLDGCVLINYQGLNAEQTQDLRTTLRRSGVLMNVVQNRLARRVFKDRGAPQEFEVLLKGPTAVLHGGDGALAASKLIVQWRKKNKDLASIKGGLFQGKALSSADVEKLASLPDANTLQAQTLSLFLSPMNHLATVTQGLLSHFAGATKAHREGLEAGQGAAPA